MAFAFYSHMANATEITKTQNQQREWVMGFLKKHITCSVNNSKILINSDGAVIDKNGSKNFTISQGDKFQNQTDEHSSLFYTIRKISGDKIIIGYESKFDHHSFDKGLVTIDSGIVDFRCN
ncbi:MAG: hypothetical protein K0R25_74 [Rickettsiaceae bacterium]|nr:hypothetical protein [Rickettsiaceae bacterium]